MKKRFLFLANSADPDEMSPYAAFHLGLNYIPKYLFNCAQKEKGLTGRFHFRISVIKELSGMNYYGVVIYLLLK